MVEQQTIKYALQWNNMTVDNVTFHTNNVMGNFNYPPNVPVYKPIIKFMLNCPLRKAITNCSSVVYQNFLREFWSTTVAYDPFPSTDETEQRPLREFLIKFSVLNRITNNPSYLDKTPVLKNSFPVAWRILFTFVIQVLGENYSFTEKVNSIQQLLAYCLITETEVDIGEIIYTDLDPSKVTGIELTAHMIVVNSQKDSVSPLPLATKPKKRKSYTVTSTLPKSQGPEVPGALSKKSKRPKSKKPPTETKVTPPKPTEGFEQSHLVSSGTVPDTQDLERNIQLATIGFPSTLDEGTRKSKHLPDGTTTHPKDSRGNIQPLDRDLTFTTSDKGTAKTTSRPEGSLGDKD
ncbi:hypothetical protein Tco_0953999 [Tanacetum coccineum]|uniref:Uncharacterized protein n=1 Tax=Tanacetum coccineum TaxID=301880 RepID=A0ABQ5E491_9ASTR